MKFARYTADPDCFSIILTAMSMSEPSHFSLDAFGYRIAAAITAGEFGDDSEIWLTEEGWLNDGHHRCCAVIRTGIAIKVHLCRPL